VVHPYNDTTLPGFEVGASIFVEVNKNLWRASTEFNLTRVDLPDGGLGIWDGDEFLLNVRAPAFGRYPRPNRHTFRCHMTFTVLKVSGTPSSSPGDMD
jgi:hypothetical protein